MAAIPLADIGKAIVYRPPAHVRPGSFIVFKRPSYPKGYYPPHLREYNAEKTGLNKCPVMCKGKTGQSYRECLVQCAIERNIRKKPLAKKE